MREINDHKIAFFETKIRCAARDASRARQKFFPAVTELLETATSVIREYARRLLRVPVGKLSDYTAYSMSLITSLIIPTSSPRKTLICFALL